MDANKFGLTKFQSEVFNLIHRRQNLGKVTKREDVSFGHGKSWVCYTLRALIMLGLVERYSGRYYRISEKGTK